MKNLLSLLFIVVFAVGCKDEDVTPPTPLFSITFNGQIVNWYSLKVHSGISESQTTINNVLYTQTSYFILLQDELGYKSFRIDFGYNVTPEYDPVSNKDRFYSYFKEGANHFHYDDELPSNLLTRQIQIQYNDFNGAWFSVEGPNASDNYFNIMDTTHTRESGRHVLNFTANFKCKVRKNNASAVVPISVPAIKGKLILM